MKILSIIVPTIFVLSLIAALAGFWRVEGTR